MALKCNPTCGVLSTNISLKALADTNVESTGVLNMVQECNLGGELVNVFIKEGKRVN